MVSSFFETLKEQPASFAHILFMSFLFMYQWNYNIPYEKIGVNYDRVMLDHEYWRIILAAYSHGSIMHIGFNMYILWSYGYVEWLLGTLTYLRFSFLLLLGSKAFMLSGTYILFTYFHRDRERQTYTVGYSGVVFGWMAVAAIILPQPYPLFGLNIPAWIMPFLFLGITQMLLSNASFIGHLSGICIGFLVGLGWCDWFDNYLFLCAFIWTLIAIIASVKLTIETRYLNWIRVIDPNEIEDREIRMVDGVIVYQDDPIGAGNPNAANGENL